MTLYVLVLTGGSSIPEFQSDLLESSARARELGLMINLVAALAPLVQSQQSVQVMILTSNRDQQWGSLRNLLTRYIGVGNNHHHIYTQK